MSAFYRSQYELMLGFVLSLVRHSNEAVSVMEDDHELDAEGSFTAYMEHVYFFLQLLDRAVAKTIIENQGDSVIDLVADLAIRVAIDARGFFLPEENKVTIYQQCCGEYRMVREAYRSLSPDVSNGKADYDPVFWEFQKKLSHIDGSFPNPGAIVARGLPLAMRAKDLNIGYFLDELFSKRW
jgi:hypothetical protein